MIAKVHVIVSAKWHHNPSTQRWSSAYSSAQRQSSAYPLGEVLGRLLLHGWSSVKSLLASSSMVVLWWLPSLPSLESPGREATMQGFPKVILPTEAIMVSLGVTPVASRFNHPMEVVTVSIHGFSPLTWSEDVGETGLSPSLVVGMIQFSTIAGLAAEGFIRSPRVPVSILVTGTITSSLGRTSAAAVRLVSVDEVVGLARMVLSVPWVVMGWGSTPSILAVVGGVMAPSGEASVFWLLASGIASSRPQKTSCLLKVTCPLLTTLTLLHSSLKGDKYPVLADLPSLSNTVELGCMPGSAAVVVAKHPDR